ncbi:ATP-binding cassette domain-containing protein [Providencia sneebia]|uniref:ABC-type dipeptide transporter n=1 Tax=Providencia sneebia DSM 19967 TaxID=1141660 RepID=K8WSF6_9GAMM|nr:nickel transporter ATP-binding protein NikD [Providencia sneebia DSM 19967]
MSLNQTSLQVKNFSVGYLHHAHTHVLISDLSFTLRRGEVLALVGASGSGKSMTCSAILDMLPEGVQKIQGTVLLEGQEISGKMLRGRQVASIMQNPRSAFNPVRTMYQHIIETLKATKQPLHDIDKRIRDVLAEVELGDSANILKLYPFEMSGGMLQRMMIAIAILSDAPFLFADEPTTDLDLIVQKKILDLLDHVVSDRKTGLLLITHDMGVVARLADNIAVLKSGEIIETGSVDDIFTSPHSMITRDLISAHLSLYGLELPA